MHGIEKQLGRPVYGLADYFFRTVPVVGTLWARPGGVSARPANAYRLLKEQQQLALVFPEGTKGTSKSFTDRYQLRRFGRGGFVEIAMRAGVPVNPHFRRRLRRGDARRDALCPSLASRPRASPTSPSPRTSSPSGPLARPPFPANFKLRVLDPFTSTSRPTRTGTRRASSWRTEPHPLTAPGVGVRHAARPAQRLVRVRPMSRRGLVTGADTFWGGRMVQALETDPASR